MKTEWTARDVWTDVNRDAILARRDEIERDQHKAKIAAYNMAHAEMWNALAEDEKDKYAETADEWTADGPPDDVVVRYVTKGSGFTEYPPIAHRMAEGRGPDWARAYAQLQWKQARTYTLQVQLHKARDGTIVSTT